MITYLLNLKRRPDRLRQALTQCEVAGVKPVVFEAVDGETLTLPSNWRQFSQGCYGCNRSHVAILEDAIRKGEDTITVFEDDVMFAKDFQLKLNSFMEIVPDDWDAIFLGGQVMGHLEDVKPGVLRAAGEKGIHRTHAYMLRGAYLSYMLDQWRTRAGHVDWIWGATQKNWKVYTPEHWLCAQSGSPSDISGRAHTSPKWWNIVPHQKKPCGCERNKARKEQAQAIFDEMRRKRRERILRSKQLKEQGESQS